jgi:hypothetical protein
VFGIFPFRSNKQWARLRWAYDTMYSRPYAYAVGFFGGDRGIRNPAHRLYAGRRRWCAPVKLWEDDNFFVKSFTATSYLPRLLVRSSSCSVLVLARWCLRVGACVSVLFLFGAGALADLKDSMNFWTLYVGLGFCRKLPYVSFREAVPHDIVHFFCT